MCCIPLFSRWFISHLPQSVMKNEQRLKWSQRLMSLSHSDIRWCLFSQKDFTFIERCGEFPNVPLLGIRGGITYNHALSLCHFGYTRRDGDHDILIQDIVFDYDNNLHGYLQRFVHAWAWWIRLIPRLWGIKTPFLGNLTSNGWRTICHSSSRHTY